MDLLSLTDLTFKYWSNIFAYVVIFYGIWDIVKDAL